MASRSWNDRILEEEASRPDACVENPEMVVEEPAVASPEHSDETLPDASEDLQSKSHTDADPVVSSYADALRVNLPEETAENDGYVTDEEQRIVERRVRTMTEFEEANFHPLNVTPDRPCTAYFNVGDNLTTAKDIFDSLLRDGIPATAVRCLQRQPNGSVLITFSTSEYRDRFLRKSAFVVRRVARASHPASCRLTFVNVYDAPHELPDSAIRERLSVYGHIYSTRRGKCQGYPDVFNGVRHLRMALTSNIPCFLRYGKHQVRIKYDQQPKTCRKCGSVDHLIKDCRNTVCFNCDQIGHVSRNCPEGRKCCICKDSSHYAIDCPHSWYKRPSLRDASPAGNRDPDPPINPTGNRDPDPSINPPAADIPTNEEQATDAAAAAPSGEPSGESSGEPSHRPILDSQGSLIPTESPVIPILEEIFGSEVDDDKDADFGTASEDGDASSSESDDPTASDGSSSADPSVQESDVLAVAAKKRRRPHRVKPTGSASAPRKPPHPSLSSKRLRPSSDPPGVP